jgi:hypothetical protein
VDALVSFLSELALYRRLIGERWPELAESLRAFLDTTEPRWFRGRVRIERSANRIAGMVARLLGLPRPGESVPAELLIIPERGREIWRRTFGDRTLITRQGAGAGGVLIERYGLLEFSFVLRIENGDLHFDLDWFRAPTALVASHIIEGPAAALRRALVIMGVGVFISGVRDTLAVLEFPYADWPWRGALKHSTPTE